MTLSILEPGPAFGCERPPVITRYPLPPVTFFVVFNVVVVVVVVGFVYFYSIMLLGNKSA